MVYVCDSCVVWCTVFFLQTDLTNELEEIEQNKHPATATARPSSAHSKGAVSHVSHDSMTESDDDDDDDFDRARVKNLVTKDELQM